MQICTSSRLRYLSDFIPGPGVVYRGGYLIDTHDVSFERDWVHTFGRCYLLLIKFGDYEADSNFIIKIGYEEYFDRGVFDRYWQVNIGFISS